MEQELETTDQGVDIFALLESLQSLEVPQEERTPLVVPETQIVRLVAQWVKDHKEEVVQALSSDGQDGEKAYQNLEDLPEYWQLDNDFDLPCGETCTFMYPAFDRGKQVKCLVVHMALDEATQSIRFAEIIEDHPYARWFDNE